MSKAAYVADMRKFPQPIWRLPSSS